MVFGRTQGPDGLKQGIIAAFTAFLALTEALKAAQFPALCEAIQDFNFKHS
jgi:hypothetical protein